MNLARGPIAQLLPYWSLNLTRFAAWGVVWWPGFHYDEAEWLIMRGLSARVQGRFPMLALWTSALFIGLAAALLFGAMLPILARFYPVGAPISPVVFILFELTAMSLLYGVGFPLALVVGAFLTDAIFHRANTGAPLSPNERHVLLKWRLQLSRVVAASAGLLLPVAAVAALVDTEFVRALPARLVQVASASVFVGSGLYVYFSGRRRA